MAGYRRAVPHGLMFHHFHDARHPTGQGSISGEELDRMIRFVGRDNILDSEDWAERAAAGRLRPEDLCITFDDNLRCQYDVALPVLQAHGIKAFWFVYTSPLEGRVEGLEVYRYFRSTRFADVSDFYAAFFQECAERPFGPEVAAALAGFEPSSYLAGFDFYTDDDRRFRYTRDKILGPARYYQVMDAMVERSGLDLTSAGSLLWMDSAALLHLASLGHTIGLHSHSHPTSLRSLEPSEQQREYAANVNHLRELLEQKPWAMSHPCNSYCEATLGILRDLGIRLGFRANIQSFPNPLGLEFPREDHANIYREMMNG